MEPGRGQNLSPRQSNTRIHVQNILNLLSLVNLSILYHDNHVKVPVSERFSFQSQLPFPRLDTVTPSASRELWFPVSIQLHYVIVLMKTQGNLASFIYIYI